MKPETKGMISGLVLHLVVFFTLLLFGYTCYPDEQSLFYLGLAQIAYFPVSYAVFGISAIFHSLAVLIGVFAILGGGYYVVFGYWIGCMYSRRRK